MDIGEQENDSDKMDRPTRMHTQALLNPRHIPASSHVNSQTVDQLSLLTRSLGSWPPHSLISLLAGPAKNHARMQPHLLPDEFWRELLLNLTDGGGNYRRPGITQHVAKRDYVFRRQ